MRKRIDLIGTPEQVLAAAKAHRQDLTMDNTDLDKLEGNLSLHGTLAYARVGDTELFGHTNDSPELVDIICPDDEADLWRFPLGSAETITIQATRGEVTLPQKDEVAIAAPKSPRYTLAGMALPPVDHEAPDYPEPDEWVQPTGAHDAYSLGAIVKWGNRWVSLTPDNVWEPGISGWREVVAEGAVAAWVQPTSAQDAYEAGAIVTHNGLTWINTHGNGNVWVPGEFGWTIYE